MRPWKPILGRAGMKRLRWLLAVLLAMAGAPALAQAPYPNKPIRMLVPYAAGGVNDVIARVVSEQARQILGQAIVIENKPGASGIVAIEEMARSRPDGYTLQVGNISTNGLTPLLLRDKMTIDYDKDVQVVARLGSVPSMFLVTTKDFPPKTFEEFLAYARANPGKIRYASAGLGSYQQLGMEMLAQKAKLDLVHIPIRQGGAQIIRDMANGDVQITWFSIANVGPMLKAGNVRPLAMALPARHPDYPDVPSVAEVGFPEIDVGQWNAVFPPAGVPREVVEKLHGAFREAMKSPVLLEAFKKSGIVPEIGRSVEEDRAWVRDEMAKRKRQVEELKITAQE